MATDQAFLDLAWKDIAAVAASANVAVVLGIERVVDDGVRISALVINRDGTLMACKPYGTPGLIVADLDLAGATRLLATRCKPL